MGFPQRRDPGVAHVVDLVRRTLSDVVRGRLVGIYPFGSLAFGDYVAGVSDIDLIAVVSEKISRADREEIVVRLKPREAIGLPGRGLDLVIVTSEDAKNPPAIPRSLLAVGLYSSRRWEPDVLMDDIGNPTPRLAAAVVRQTETYIAGPAPQFMFGPITRQMILDACSQELEWWLDHTTEASFSRPVLNACRAWMYVEEGELGSKLAGGEWATGRIGYDGLVQTALAAQYGRKHNGHNPAEVREILIAASARLSRAS